MWTFYFLVSFSNKREYYRISRFFEFYLCSGLGPNRTGHINLVILTPSHVCHTSLSTCCFPHKPHTPHSWWPATEITEQWFEGQLGGLIAFCSFNSLAVDRCWAWRMVRPLVVDRKWRGPKERGPASTRLPWRIKTNRYAFFIEFVRVCVCVRACYFRIGGWSERLLCHLFKYEGVGEGWSFDMAVKSVTEKVPIEIYFCLCWH